MPDRARRCGRVRPARSTTQKLPDERASTPGRGPGLLRALQEAAVGRSQPCAHPGRSDEYFVDVTPAGVTILMTSGSQRVLTADVRALGIPCLGAQDALAGKTRNPA
jgi:hypothetical protein